MTVTAAPALRTALHLLLALCLLLQGASAAAMASTTALLGGTTTETPHAPAAAEHAEARPPCHAVAKETPSTAATPVADDLGCCDAAGGLCEWACTPAPSLPVALAQMPLRIEPSIAPLPVASTDPRWPTSAPLRPPIA